MRLLVVEDDIDLARQLGEGLGQAGYVVDVANDGEEGHFWAIRSLMTRSCSIWGCRK